MLQIIYNKYDTISSEQSQRTLTKRNIRALYQSCGQLRKHCHRNQPCNLSRQPAQNSTSSLYTLSVFTNTLPNIAWSIHLSKIHRHIFWCCHWLSFLLPTCDYVAGVPSQKQPRVFAGLIVIGSYCLQSPKKL